MNLKRKSLFKKYTHIYLRKRSEKAFGVAGGGERWEWKIKTWNSVSNRTVCASEPQWDSSCTINLLY